MNIRMKILLAVSVIVAIITISLSTMGYYEAKHDILADVNKADSFIREKRLVIENLAKTLENVSYEKESYLAHMKNARDTLGIHGVYAAFEDNNYIDTAGWVPPSDYIVTSRPWYSMAINNSKRRDKRAVKLSDAFINKLGARYSLLSVNSPSADLTISAIFNVVKSSVDSDSNNILKFVFATPISLSPAPVFSSLILI